jgi:hypothetical protein
MPSKISGKEVFSANPAPKFESIASLEVSDL